MSNRAVGVNEERCSDGNLILTRNRKVNFARLRISTISSAPPMAILCPCNSSGGLNPSCNTSCLLLPSNLLSVRGGMRGCNQVRGSVRFSRVFPGKRFTMARGVSSCALETSNVSFGLASYLLSKIRIVIAFRSNNLTNCSLTVIRSD